MVTYLVLCLVFGVLAAVPLLVLRARAGAGERVSGRSVAVSALALLVLTAVFDNVMIGVGLVAYDDSLRLGLTVGRAPVEDFAYPLAGVLLLPALWHLLDRR